VLDTTYDVEYSERAAVDRDRLPADRREAFNKGMAIIARDPTLPQSRPLGPDGWTREVRVTNQIMIEYTIIHHAIVVLVFRIFDDQDIIVPT
jgi:hypothetical protein